MTITVYPIPAATIGGPLTAAGSIKVGLDAATLDQQGLSPDAARAVHIVGNPAGDFAGANPLELALDESTGVTLKVAIPGGLPPVTIANPTAPTVFPVVQAVSQTNLPPNAAVENLGQLAQVLECLQKILVELRLANYQTLVASGVPDEQEAFRNDTTIPVT